jgi:hypothetical protein
MRMYESGTLRHTSDRLRFSFPRLLSRRNRQRNTVSGPSSAGTTVKRPFLLAICYFARGLRELESKCGLVVAFRAFDDREIYCLIVE